MYLAEIAAYIDAQGIATSGVDLFYGAMKEQYPSQVVLIAPYGGEQPEPNTGDVGGVGGLGRAVRLEFPRIQIVTRGVKNDIDTPYSLGYAVHAALMRVVNQSLYGVRYLAIEPLEQPTRLFTDLNFREVVKFNVKITKELSSGSVVTVPYTLIADFGGDYTAFSTMAVSDAYPSGASGIIPGSWSLPLNADVLNSTYTLEAAATVSDTASGKRPKIALYDLDTDTIVAGSEITFSVNADGETARSGSFTLPAGTVNIGAKVTIDSTTIMVAGYGVHLLRV